MAENEANLTEAQRAWLRFAESDYISSAMPQGGPTATDRQASAAEVTAFRICRIDRNLARLVELLEAKQASK